ncbi:MAG TPA: RpiB/LacA/LacB family sugar-phosphate isomerase [Candidatus Uhrbacteria bacterium]|nr:RpiB/LacA/LacB family sugar-phosphate isomerase [Candidatus Uhrbacteria bacterium]
MVYLGADHAGFALKEQIKKYLDKKNISYEDKGSLKLKKGDDYPDFGYKVAKAVAENKNAKGILICGTSYGMCIVANKVKGARAVSVKNEDDAVEIRKHNDANIMCLSGWNISPAKANKIIDKFLNTKFEAVLRRKRRLNKIKKIENKEFK